MMTHENNKNKQTAVTNYIESSFSNTTLLSYSILLCSSHLFSVIHSSMAIQEIFLPLHIVRRWEDLNIDCLARVFGKVGLKQLLLDVPLVCKSWHRASLTPSCWTNIDFPSVTDDMWLDPPVSDLIKLVVDRSSGSADKIVLPRNCTLQDLEYVSDQCPAVRNLTLPFIISSYEERQHVPKMIGKFKELQMLKIYLPCDLEEVVAEISNNCNDFQALVTNGKNVRNKVASAVVTFLPNIKYLVLRRADIPRESLMHILDGCRHLVLLDVQNCTGFDEDDQEILQRASHIKTFRPQGSTLYDEDDYYESLSSRDVDFGGGSD